MRHGGQRSPEPARDPTSWVDWRAARLLAAGFSEPLAKGLAGDSRVDVHALLELVDRGCPPNLAARIMAPIDGDPRSR